MHIDAQSAAALQEKLAALSTTVAETLAVQRSGKLRPMEDAMANVNGAIGLLLMNAMDATPGPKSTLASSSGEMSVPKMEQTLAVGLADLLRHTASKQAPIKPDQREALLADVGALAGVLGDAGLGFPDSFFTRLREASPPVVGDSGV